MRSVILASVLLATAIAPAASVASGPVTYDGTVTAASGRVAAQQGRHVTVTLTGFFVPVPSGVDPFGTFAAVVRCVPPGNRCPAGTVKGSWGTKRTLPDTGAAVTLKGRGHLRRLGIVKARGGVHGPGNIGAGQPVLTLRLRGHHGKLTITATAPTVPGFTPIF